MESTEGREQGNRWYLVHAHARREDLAEEHLRRQGFQTFLPLQRRTIRHAHRVKTVLAAYFPGYLFVSFDPEHDRWRSINSTVGVIRLVTANERPLPAPPWLVPSLQAACDGDGILHLTAELRPGQSVRVLAGPFSEQLGTIERLGPADRVRVLLSMMGAIVPVTIRRSELEPAAPPRPEKRARSATRRGAARARIRLSDD